MSDCVYSPKPIVAWIITITTGDKRLFYQTQQKL